MMESKANMQCEFCGGTTVQRRVRKSHWLKKRLYLLEDVPAEVCPECGERYFHAQVLDRIDRLLMKEHQIKQQIQVEVVSMQEMALAV